MKEELSKYWKKFEEFNQTFKNTGRIEISNSFENARSYVNGMTDGWHEFMNGLKETQKSFKTELSEKENQKLNNIILELAQSLKRK